MRVQDRDRQMNITRVSLILEINGKPHVAFIDDVDVHILVDVVAALTKEKVLKVMQLPKDYSFEKIEKD